MKRDADAIRQPRRPKERTLRVVPSPPAEAAPIDEALTEALAQLLERAWRRRHSEQ
jgi:hypothetical protein